MKTFKEQHQAKIGPEEKYLQQPSVFPCGSILPDSQPAKTSGNVAHLNFDKANQVHPSNCPFGNAGTGYDTGLRLNRPRQLPSGNAGIGKALRGHCQFGNVAIDFDRLRRLKS